MGTHVFVLIHVQRATAKALMLSRLKLNLYIYGTTEKGFWGILGYFFFYLGSILTHFWST